MIKIFTYVKNKDTVFGDDPYTGSCFFYAAIDEVIQPDNSYQMNGSMISIWTLDLSQDFSEIVSLCLYLGDNLPSIIFNNKVYMTKWYEDLIVKKVSKGEDNEEFKR